MIVFCMLNINKDYIVSPEVLLPLYFLILLEYVNYFLKVHYSVHSLTASGLVHSCEPCGTVTALAAYFLMISCCQISGVMQAEGGCVRVLLSPVTLSLGPVHPPDSDLCCQELPLRRHSKEKVHKPLGLGSEAS